MRLVRVLLAVTAGFLLSVGFVVGADAPVYKDGVLTIPSVNTTGQVGQYQDLTFKLTEQGYWQLSSLKAMGSVIGNAGLGLAPIGKVEVIKTDTFPAQVFLRVSGAFGDGCPHMGQVNQRLESNRFDITVANQYVVGQICPAIVTPFVKTFPLAVYGLSAGTYSYNVNGTTGTFTLTADNKYPGDY